VTRGYLSEDVPREKRTPEEKSRHLAKLFVGVDGEGQDTPDGRHIYTYLCAADEHGTILSEKWADDGLTHEECCEVLLSIPPGTLNFGYMTSYDITKWIEGMPDEEKYRLLRPDTRKVSTCLDCHRSWNLEHSSCPFCGHPKFRERNELVRYAGRGYDFFNGSFTLKDGYDVLKKAWTRVTKLWDCIRFFGCSFVQAITDWKVGTKFQQSRIASMKERRGKFADENPKDIRVYCQEECTLLAQMMRKVVEGHEEAGWKLKSFYGAGSTGKAMLTANGVKEFKGPRLSELDEAHAQAVMSAFFGGRFEDSVVGLVREPVWSKDIASAYPYAMTFLPCLACGRWKRVKGRGVLSEISRAPLAVCRFRVKDLPEAARKDLAWAPLPFRDEMGSIAYPLNFSGWAWKPEILSAKLGWPELVDVTEAWIYDRRCEHKPFGFMPDVYRRRVAIGKEGPGLVLKLGANAGYGVTAQSIGDDPPFQQWIWAGVITSTCRAMGLDVMRFASNPWQILTIATDGITGTFDFNVPLPFNTGTEGCRDPAGNTKQPLGGWESDTIPEGMFIAKPGMYFRLETDLKKLRARGIGRKELFGAKDALIQSFLSWDRRDMKHKFQVVSRRFWGAKSVIYGRSRCDTCNTSWPGTPEKLCPKCTRVGTSFEVKRQTQVTDETRKDEGRKDVYGTWGERMIDIRFDPYPKRERIVGSGDFSRLFVRDVGGAESMPYKGQKSPEVLSQVSELEMLEEQPDVVEGILEEVVE
jgi:hypothetical protein